MITSRPLSFQVSFGLWCQWIQSLLCLGLLLSTTACRGRADRPNIILMLVDTLRADYLGVYGFEGEISPNLDRFAEESVVFLNCFSQSPWTKPAVASLFTSLYPESHGLTNHEGKYWGDPSHEARMGILSDRAVTLAEALRERGYQTAAFISNPWIQAKYGFAQGFDVYDEQYLVTNRKWPVDTLARKARSWLESRNPDEPFFLYLHFMDVHAPYPGSRSDFDTLIESPSLGSDLTLTESEAPDIRWKNIENRPEWATNRMRRRLSYWRARYASGVRTFDRRLASFLKSLSRTGEFNDSYVIVTSDHGEELFEHGDWSHGQNLFDHQLHVPLLIRNPKGQQGGRRVEKITELIDLMPTLLSIAGAESEAPMQGQDISSYFFGNPPDDARVSFATATQRNPALHSLRTKRHKFILNVKTGQSRLFDILADPGEKKGHPGLELETAQVLRDQLTAHVAQSAALGTFPTKTTDVSEEELERLKSLGYIR